MITSVKHICQALTLSDAGNSPQSCSNSCSLVPLTGLNSNHTLLGSGFECLSTACIACAAWHVLLRCLDQVTSPLAAQLALMCTVLHS